MTQRRTPPRTFRGLGSMAAAALVAGLALVIAMPGVVSAWNSYSFSSTEEARLLTMINQLRAANGKAALTVDSTLASEARKRSKDMYDRNYFSHDSPDANTTFDAFDDLKAMGYCYKAAGENIAKNNYPDPPYNPDTTTVAFNGWKNSSGHLANMLGSYTVIGIGIFKGDGRNGGSDSAAYPDHLFTAIFAYKCASATPPPTATPRPTATATPRPTATATPRPTATATPRPTATPKATPKPTPRPTAGANPTPTPQITPAPTPEPTPEVTPEPTPSATPDVLDPWEALGALGTDPRNWPGNLHADGSAPEPSPDANGDATPAPGGFVTGDADGLQVVEPLPDADLLDSIVGGVAGTFFGH
jgi:uncharacterized protein YkwD